MEDIKDRLKTIRKTFNLKQREMTERLEVSVAQFSAWETGKENVPRARIYQLCKEFNVRRDWLVNGSGEMFEPKPDARLISEFSNQEIYNEALERLFASLPPDAKEAVRRFAQRYDERFKYGIPISELRPFRGFYEN